MIKFLLSFLESSSYSLSSIWAFDIWCQVYGLEMNGVKAIQISYFKLNPGLEIGHLLNLG